MIMGLKLSERHEWVVQSEIRNMSIECDLLGGINLSQESVMWRSRYCEGRRQRPWTAGAIYTRYDGIAELRAAIAAKQKALTGLRDGPGKEIVVSAGSTGALYCACLAS
jgi:aminotransferase